MRLASQSSRLALALAISSVSISPANANEETRGYPPGIDATVQAMDRGDFVTARNIVEPLANSGDADAQNLLGLLYMRGNGVTQNPREAARLFRLCADHGNKRCQFQLARLLLEGVGVEKDEVEAFRYFEMSAKQGVAVAQLALGTLLAPGAFEGNPGIPGAMVGDDGQPLPGDYGERIPKDAVMSAYWFRLAAEQGNPDAQFSLGLAYEDGLGVPLNLAEAVRLYRLAAKQGHSGAQNNLGVKYDRGQGVIRDNLKAYMWFSIAAASGDAKSTANRDSAGERLTPRQRTQAEQMAARCVETQFAACE